jgi:hypothetical protein
MTKTEKPFQPAIDTIRLAEEIIRSTSNAAEACTLALCVLCYVMHATNQHVTEDLNEAVADFPGVAATREAAGIPIN